MLEAETLATRPAERVGVGREAGGVMEPVPQFGRFCFLAGRARVFAPQVERLVAAEDEVLAGVAHNMSNAPHALAKSFWLSDALSHGFRREVLVLLWGTSRQSPVWSTDRMMK